MVENEAILELRDCLIRSKKDRRIQESEKEALIQAKLRGEAEPENADVEDFCFILNRKTVSDKD